MRKLRHNEIERLSPDAFRDLPKHPIKAVIEDVRSIHNVGSMFRTADAAAIEQLILCGITGTPENRMIHKTALGAEETVNWTHQGSSVDAIRILRESGYCIAALEITDTPTRVSDLAIAQFPLALIVGNEVGGLKHESIAEADVAIEIPQYGTKQSFNVAVAFGIAIMGIVDRYRELHSVA